MASENKARDSQQHINPVTVLLDSMRAALETYSNVHRGSGHKSQVPHTCSKRPGTLYSITLA